MSKITLTESSDMVIVSTANLHKNSAQVHLYLAITLVEDGCHFG